MIVQKKSDSHKTFCAVQSPVLDLLKNYSIRIDKIYNLSAEKIISLSL
jgi:hypothetical protein